MKEVMILRSVDVRVTQNKIAAMEVYIQEYIHRDTHMWNLSLKFYFASLIITLLPLLNIIELPISLKTHKIIFPIVGIILAFLFLYIAFHPQRRAHLTIGHMAMMCYNNFLLAM